MTRKEAIEMLKSKLDGNTDTSYEWVEAVGMAIKALCAEDSNSDGMLFPKDWHVFLDYYAFKDTESAYTNGSYLIQKFRAEQALEHYADGLFESVLNIIDGFVCWRQDSFTREISDVIYRVDDLKDAIKRLREESTYVG